jgi:SWI/SNF-related matrix-associated actin-dependent regulator 1 of chromatin subfamily A
MEHILKMPRRSLLCRLCTQYRGTWPDGVTPRREIFVKITCLKHIGSSFKRIPEKNDEAPFNIDEKHDMEHILDGVLQYKWIQPGNATLRIHVKDYHQFTQLCATQEWDVEEYIPDTIMKHVIEHVTRPLVTMQQIEQKIGTQLYEKLRPFQRTGVQFAVSKRKSYIAGSMGTGKTIQAIATASYFSNLWPAVVFVPAVMKTTWQNEIAQWLGIEKTRILILKNARHLQKPLPENIAFVIISYGLLPNIQFCNLVKTKRFQIAIMDECHYVKSPSSKRSKGAFQIMRNIPIRIMLSGTPCSYAVDLYQQIKILYPEIYPKFFTYTRSTKDLQFVTRYCQPKQVQFGRQIQWTFKGYVRSNELESVLLTFMLRTRKKDVLPQLPPKNRSLITLPPLPKKEQKEIENLLVSQNNKQEQKQNKRPKHNTDFDFDDKANPVRFGKAFHKTAQFKIPGVIQFIKSYVVDDVLKMEPEKRFVVYTHHIHMREAVEELLKKENIAFFSIHGGTPTLQRGEYQQDFQNSDKYQAAVLSLEAASTGINLNRANLMIFTELHSSPQTMLQAEDRCHRIGTTAKQINYFYLMQPDTTDNINFQLILIKERESSRILDGQASHISHQQVDNEKLREQGAATLLNTQKQRQRKRKAKQIETYFVL